MELIYREWMRVGLFKWVLWFVKEERFKDKEDIKLLRGGRDYGY